MTEQHDHLDWVVPGQCTSWNTVSSSAAAGLAARYMLGSRWPKVGSSMVENRGTTVSGIVFVITARRVVRGVPRNVFGHRDGAQPRQAGGRGGVLGIGAVEILHSACGSPRGQPLSAAVRRGADAVPRLDNPRAATAAVGWSTSSAHRGVGAAPQAGADRCGPDHPLPGAKRHRRGHRRRRPDGSH